MSKQNWWPDTCGCCVEEDVTAGNITFSKVIKKCVDHAAVPDNQLYSVLFAAPAGENKRRNKLMKYVLELGISGLSVQNNGVWEWAPGVSVSWTWSGSGDSRVLTIAVTGYTLTTAQRNAAQTWCNNQFGVGKVIIA